MKYLCVTLLFLLTACSNDETPFVRVKDCPSENYEQIEKFINSCRLGNTSVSYCRAEAEEIYCKESFIKNPNYIEED